MEINLKTQTKLRCGSQKMNSSMGLSRYNNNRKSVSKLSAYQTNIQNYNQNYKFSLQKIDPKGIQANGVFVAFSGVIQSLQLFCDEQLDLQVFYQLKVGDQWHDETPQISDTSGSSTFCSSKNGKITFSLGFDTLVSCMYIQSWPQLLLTMKGFDQDGDVVTKAYAQIFLPTRPGMRVQEAAVYQIVRNVKWYQRWIPFWEANHVSYDRKQFKRVIEKGQGRQSQKIKCIGKVKVRTEVLLRNYNRLGYQ